MTYQSRDKTESRAPSAGLATRPIGGLGKLDTGLWKLTVLSVTRRPLSEDLLLESSTGHVHHERVHGWPTILDQPGTQLEGRVGPGTGFALERDVARFRGVDAQTRAPLTGWTADVAQVYNQLVGRGLAPATTKLEAVRYGTSDWIGVCVVNPSDSGEAAPPSAAAPAAADGAPSPGDVGLAGSGGGAE